MSKKIENLFFMLIIIGTVSMVTYYTCKKHAEYKTTLEWGPINYANN